MDAAWLTKIEKLYHAARDCSPQERIALLSQADAKLRREVESLLAQDGSGGLLGRPAIDAAASLFDEATVARVSPGTQLGPYRIEAPLAAGGMGQVYRARDTRLDRAVAIKINHEHFSARFEREARAISSLNHPHICTLYDVGPNYLVMELVEGETLAARLSKGPMPLEQALRYGAEIADALAAAHARGVIHRDLKPGNIMITKAGVKVLDFGLARSEGDETLTASHAVMGTPAYMAPEQRAGKECDARTDIYALGLVLCEMATGNREGKLDELPPHFAHVVERCLAKDPDSRWRAAADVRAELEWIGRQPTLAAAQQPAPKRLSAKPWVIVSAVLAGALVASLWPRPHPVIREPVRLTVEPPENTSLLLRLDSSLSPDGRRIAFAAQDSGGGTAIWTRSVDELESRRLAGTEDGSNPFWSPDGQFLGFFAQGRLKKIAMAGGPPQNICTTTPGLGATWSASGVIVFTPANRAPLMRVPASGGTPQALTALDTGRQENSHRWPSFLPDGRHFLFTARSSLKENTAIYIGSLDSKGTKRVLTEQSNAVYASPGYLLFGRDGTLTAQRFDANKLELSGDPVPVAGGVEQATPSANAYFSVSLDGSAVSYLPARRASTQLTWFDRAGSKSGFAAPRGQYSNPRLSPDGKRLAVVAPDTESGNRDIWLIELERGTRTRFTSNPANDWQPAWSPDGAYLAFVSDRMAQSSVFQKRADESGQEELLALPSPVSGVFQPDWSPDGRYLAYKAGKGKGDIFNIWLMPLIGERIARPFLTSQFEETNPKFSPDGKWLAYSSDESGAFEVYIRSLDGPTKQRVSTGGGLWPSWRQDGKELFYAAPGNAVMAADVKLHDRLTVAVPTLLFHTCAANGDGVNPYEPTRDGKRFLVACAEEDTRRRSIIIDIQWISMVKWPSGARP